MSTNALVLSGGGARAAYQVGVLHALAEIRPDLHNPFPIICGTSAGAINALAIAAHPGKFRKSIRDLMATWEELHVDRVYKTGWKPLTGGIFKVAASLFNQGIGRDKPLALLDNTPLRELLTEVIPFSNLNSHIASGKLKAVSITALGYTSGESVSFFQGSPELRGWRRARRVGAPSKIGVEHLLASSAIPAIFPSIHLHQEYFGDGAMRQVAPISPALHLGANRIFVVGVSNNRNPAHWGKQRVPAKHSPSIAQIIGQMFNSAFIDSLEGDLEHLERVNDLLALAGDKRCEETKVLRPVDSLVISPSKSLDKIAGRHIRDLPQSMQIFMRAIGATSRGGGGSAASYLLFSHEYCKELMELGYQDAMWEKETILRFFDGPQND